MKLNSQVTLTISVKSVNAAQYHFNDFKWCPLLNCKLKLIKRLALPTLLLWAAKYRMKKKQQPTNKIWADVAKIWGSRAKRQINEKLEALKILSGPSATQSHSVVVSTPAWPVSNLERIFSNVFMTREAGATVLSSFNGFEANFFGRQNNSIWTVLRKLSLSLRTLLVNFHYLLWLIFSYHCCSLILPFFFFS